MPDSEPNSQPHDTPPTKHNDLINHAASGDSQCMVVMYHYIRDTEPFSSHGVGGLTSRSFRQQLDSLCTRYEPIDWPTFYAWSQGRASIPQRTFLTTFDDGLKDHAQTVAPILKEYGLRGTFFTAGQPMASQTMLTAHMLHLLLAQLGECPFQQDLLSYLDQHAPERDWWAAMDLAKAERMYHYESVSRGHLKYFINVELPTEIARRAIEHLFQAHIGSPARWSQHWYLSWDDLTALQSEGHTIGGHGYTHDPLAEMSLSDQWHDIQRISSMLHDGLGADRRPFSYPFGSFSDGTKDLVKQAGFAQAFSTKRNMVISGAGPYDLPRIDTIDVDAVMRKDQICPQP